jgi:hypothetical protein
MKTKLIAMLVCLAFVATAIPSVSATAAILTTVDDESVYVMVEGTQTADDVNELLGVSLEDTESLYVSYYNLTGVLTATSFVGAADADDIVWFDIELPNINVIVHHVYFSDEAIVDVADVDEALYVNEPISDETNIFIVTVPTGVVFAYDENGYEYDNDVFVVTDEDGDEIGNITSFNYSAEFNVYGMNLTETSSHQLVIVTDELMGTTTAAVGKRVTVHKWYWMDTTAPYSMSVEKNSAYNFIAGTEGYVAFNVYNDYAGLFGKYLGGKTPFRMTADTLEYGTHHWYWPFTTTWNSIATHEASIAGVKIGLVERIYISEETGAEDNDEILRDNYGIITSKGVSTGASGLEYLTMGTTKVSEAVIDTGATIFG